MKPSTLTRAARALRAIVVAGLALLVYMRFIEPATLRVQRDTLLHTGLAPLRVGVIADLHLGVGSIDDDRAARAVRTVNGLGADVIVLLGDYSADNAWARPTTPEAVAEILRPLRAPLGVYAVLGNHDRWIDAPRFERALGAVGISVLENRGVALGRDHLWLAGLSDDFSASPDLDAALRGAPDDARVLAITHSPDVFPRLPERVRVLFAGHTHGGQIRLPFIKTTWIPSHLARPYVRGVYRAGGRQLYVSSGVGMSILPLRLGVPPEVNLVTLTDP